MSRRDEGSVSYDQKRKRWIGRYWVAMSDGSRQRKQVSAETKRICLDRVNYAIGQAKAGIGTAKDPYLQDYLSSWLEGRSSDLAPRTVKDYQRAIKPLSERIGKIRLSNLSVHDVELSFLGMPTRTAGMMRAVLRAALNDAMRQEIISRNVGQIARPPKHIPKPKSILSPSVLSHVIESEPNPVYQAMFAFLALQGARPCEAIALTWGMVKEADGLLWYTGAKTEAGRRSRPIYPGLSDILRSIRSETSPYVFPSMAGTPIGKRNLNRAWDAALARVKAPHVTLYSLRHFAATSKLAAGMSDGLVAALLGHSDPSITRRYYEVIQSDALAKVVRNG